MLKIERFILLAGKPEPSGEEVLQQGAHVADQNAWIDLAKLQEDQHHRGRRSVEVVKSAYG